MEHGDYMKEGAENVSTLKATFLPESGSWKEIHLSLCYQHLQSLLFVVGVVVHGGLVSGDV